MGNNLQEAINALKEKNQTQKIAKKTTTKSTPPISQVYSIPSTDILLDNLRKAVKLERNNQGLTQREIANKAHLSQATITRAERHMWISIYSLLKIIKALNKELILN